MLKIGYIIFSLAFSLGIFGMFYWKNYFRKIISFAVFSNSSIVLFVTIAYKQNSLIPIHNPNLPENTIYTDPIPSVLMLTAIVVGISIQAIALSLYLSFAKKKD
jgi:multicomponent Na+:H+ antiporter subunit C